MADESVVPDRDPAEDDLPAGADPLPDRPSSSPEVPEADALEQAEEVEVGPRRLAPSRDPEVPEADAWEQAQEVPLDDEGAGREINCRLAPSVEPAMSSTRFDRRSGYGARRGRHDAAA